MSENKKLSRHECRELIFKLLFAKEFDRDADPGTYYTDYTENAEEPSADYVKEVFLGVCASLPALDCEIEAASDNWKLARMSTATRSVLRMAVYEMTQADVPAKAAINEALELIKLYDEDSAPKFVNGILNKIARERGLIES
ncbi:MAG: transcription antitermination factor NusB [Clostridia bacterium]|nr:transcription antitermination factor NusB [Clostridia bacterium]MBQ4193476.1 transcription antitermination factor NusB [Clostridia bacterium]MBQ4349853.1 transcription antitermination factor NusB [Clostridia bacterium]